MYALNWNRDFTAEDGLVALAPFDPHAGTAGALRGAVHSSWAPAVAGGGGVVVAALIMLAGPFAGPLVLALGGSAGFVYLGTALVSGRLGVAAFDLGAAVAAIGIAVAAPGPAISALLVHAVWGILRSALPGAAPGRCFAASWAAFHATAALLLGFGA